MYMLELLNQIGSTTKRKEKEQLLENCSEPEQMKTIARLAYDPNYDYYIKEFDMPESFNGTHSLDWALEVLVNEIATRKVTGNAARERLNELLESLSEDDAEVLKRIVKGDLRCGVSGATINKVWKDTVYIHPYSRCSSFNEKNLSNITLPCFSQVKMDGLYLDIVSTPEGTIEYRSRQGSYLPLNVNIFDDTIAKSMKGFVLMGEALVRDGNGGYLPREEGNGIINSDDVVIDDVVYVCWDIVPYDDFMKHKTEIPYDQRFQALQSMIAELNHYTDRFVLIDSRRCTTKDEIIEHFKENLEKGEEGCVIKDDGYLWKHGTSKYQIKMKIEFECEVKIVGWNYGEKGTKFEHSLGTLEVESSDGIVKFNVGTGFKDSEREAFLNHVDEWIEKGQVITVKGNGLVTNKLKPDYYAIYLARLVEIRTDKDEADSYDKIVEIIDSYTETLEQLKM